MVDVPNAGLDSAQNAILTSGTTYYCSLHTADPGKTGASEGTDGRQAIVFGASSAGSQSATTLPIWPSAVGGQTYTYYGIWTTATAGTYLRGGTIGTAITPTAGEQIKATAVTFTDS